MSFAMLRPSLVIGLALPVVAHAQLTPGQCLGYMPIMAEHFARQIASAPVAESTGNLHVLQARKVSEKGKSYRQNASQLRRLQSRDFSSDFDQDRKQAIEAANSRVQASLRGTSVQKKQVQQDHIAFERACDQLLVKARGLRSAGAFESLMSSIEKDGK